MNKQNESLIKLDRVGKHYMLGRSRIDVLKNINWEINRGDWVSLLGSSGCGKTTLLNLIGCLERPDTGEIEFDGVNYSSLGASAAEFRGRKIGFVFQNYSLLPEFTILENVLIGGSMANANSNSELRRRAGELLEEVGLGGRLGHRPGELSGGEQQRAAIARALIKSPDLLLADEPTGNLDEKTGEMVLELFRKLREKNPSCTILMVTHNPQIAKLTDHSYTLHQGIISQQR